MNTTRPTVKMNTTRPTVKMNTTRPTAKNPTQIISESPSNDGGKTQNHTPKSSVAGVVGGSVASVAAETSKTKFNYINLKTNIDEAIKEIERAINHDNDALQKVKVNYSGQSSEMKKISTDSEKVYNDLINIKKQLIKMSDECQKKINEQ